MTDVFKTRTHVEEEEVGLANFQDPSAPKRVQVPPPPQLHLPLCPVIWIKTQCKPQKCHSLGTLSGHMVGRPAQNGEGDREKQEGVMQGQSSMLPSGTFLSKGPALTSSSATAHRNTGSHPSADGRATPGPCWAGRGRMR